MSKTSQNRSKTLLVLSWLSRVLLGAIWEGFGGQRLPPRTRLSVIKTIVGRLEASRSLKHRFGRFLEAKWYHFGSILKGFWVPVGRNLDAASCVTNPVNCHKNNFREYLRPQDCSNTILPKHQHKGYPPIRNNIPHFIAPTNRMPTKRHGGGKRAHAHWIQYNTIQDNTITYVHTYTHTHLHRNISNIYIYIQVRVRAFSATVPFRGRAVRWSNHRWSIVSNGRVASVLVLEQKGT